MSNFEYNMDNDLRLSILGRSSVEWEKNGGILNFDCMPYNVLKKLIDNGFVDVNETQNDSPSIKEFMEFVEKYLDENIWFVGYLVSPSRPDYRVSIDGLNCITTNHDLIEDFMTTFKHATELTYEDEELYCWYD